MRRVRLASLSVLPLAGALSATQPTVAGDPQRPYEGYRLVAVEVRNAKELLAISQIGEPMACIPAPGLSEYLIPPDAMGALEALGLPFVVRENNVQTLVDQHAALNDAARAERGSFFTAYRTYTEISNHLDTLAAHDDGPLGRGNVVDKFTLGTSIQGRTIHGLRITTPTAPGEPVKPVFVITATQHAREWAAASSAMWIADRLVREYGVDPVATSLVNGVDFRIIPVVNPDGYVYTFPTNQGGGGQRLWRKNRRLNSGGSYGVDLNRNWGVGWGLSSGSSGTQSSETYRGTAPFSEPETAAVRDHILALPNIKGHIDLHTYSQLVLGPWGYTTAAPPRTGELNPLTSAMVQAISSQYGTSWTGGPAGATLYLASGVAPDWSFGDRGALAWTFELRDTGYYGFLLPPDQIVPAAVEAWAGIVVLAQHVQIRLRINVPSPPASLTPGQATPFAVAITTENQYSLQSGSAALMWRFAGEGAFNAAPLTGGPTSFTATIPACSCGRTVEFFVQATASDGLVVRDPAATVYTAQTPPCPGCLGDANGDRRVDFTDLTAILTNWGRTGLPGLTGDCDYNGVVDFTDISTLLAMWNTTCL